MFHLGVEMMSYRRIINENKNKKYKIYYCEVEDNNSTDPNVIYKALTHIL